MSHPLVSCVIPVFNGEAYLGEALESVLAQTYPNLEIIVVDDGSTDGSRELAMAVQDPRVRCLHQDRRGPAAARNRGVSQAAGDFLTFLDADDLWHPQKTERQLARMEARPEQGASFTMLRNFWSPEAPPAVRELRREDVDSDFPGWMAQTMLARRAAFSAVGPFREELQHSSEAEWIVRAREGGIVLELLEDCLVFRRFHGDNFSRREAEDSRQEYLGLLKESLDRRRAQVHPGR